MQRSGVALAPAPCVCVCVLGNPVEMKGAATHWPGDYGVTFVSVPGLNCKSFFSSLPFLKVGFYWNFYIRNMNHEEFMEDLLCFCTCSAFFSV